MDKKILNTRSDKLIGSLALLKSGFLKTDFISTYIPFVSTVLYQSSLKKEDIKLDSIISNFAEEFGFTIDRAPMTTLLNKCAKLGIISKQKNASFIVNMEKCSNYRIEISKIAEKTKIYKIIIDKLILFYKSNFDIEISLSDAEDQLLKFLDENSCQTLLVDFNKITSEEQTSKQHQYVISCFIKYCNENDASTYILIRDLATAYLMSSAIAYNEKDQRSAVAQFNGLVIYLDTPFVLKVLGLNEISMQKASLAMLNQLITLGCTFKIFAHNFQEIEQIIHDCVRWIENDRYDDFYASIALRTFIQKEYTKVELQAYLDSLLLRLKYYKILIDDEDYYAGKYQNSQIDEEEIKQNIIKVYKNRDQAFNPEEKAVTINYDVKSISFIFKLWGKKVARTYSQAKYIFVTTNTTLAYISRKYLQQNNKNYEHKIYPCLTDVFLGTNIWLNAPVELVEDFSQKKLLADCMAILQPSDQLITQLLSSIEHCFADKTISESQYYLLKMKAFENNYLMNRTLSDETKFSDKITEELLEDIELSIVKPFKQEISKLKKDLDEKDVINEKYFNLLKVSTYKEKEEEEKNDKLKEDSKNCIEFFQNIIITLVILPIISAVCSGCSFLPWSDNVNKIILMISIIIEIFSAVLLLFLKLNLLNFREFLCNKKYESLKTKEYRKSISVKYKNK